jgi:small nuclear ribonucleoprotein G
MSSKGPNLKSIIHSLIFHLSPLIPCVFFLFARSYLDKTISLHLNKGRKVSGTLRGYDQFMNIVLGDTMEEVTPNEHKPIGMVVCKKHSRSFSIFPDSYFHFPTCSWDCR